MRLQLAGALLAGSIAFAGSAQAQQLEKKEFNVVGTWNFLTNWQKLEQPFWTKELPDASGGNLKGNIKSITEVNLKGTEVLRLLKQGVFDFAAALPIYVEDGGAIIEAVDIAGVARDLQDEPRDHRHLDAGDAEGHDGAPRRDDPGHVHVAGAELLLQGRHQEHRGPEGQEGPRAGHLAGRSRQGARRRRR